MGEDTFWVGEKVLEYNHVVVTTKPKQLHQCDGVNGWEI